MSRDPFPGLMQVPQTMNPYVYVGNNPDNVTDPSGQIAPLLIPLIVGGVLGGGFAYWAYLQEHPCADFFHDRAFQQAVGAGMLAGVAGGAAGYLAGYVLVALMPEAGLASAIVVGTFSGSAGSGATQITTNALTSRSLTDGLTAALLAGGLIGGVGGAAGHGVARVLRQGLRNASAGGILTEVDGAGGKAFVSLSRKSAASHIWSSRKGASSARNALGHWKKHSLEFPEYHNAKQYVEGAWQFMDNPPAGTLTKIRPNGDALFYNPSTNTFAVRSVSGTPRTMFRPDEGMRYWLAQ